MIDETIKIAKSLDGKTRMAMGNKGAGNHIWTYRKCSFVSNVSKFGCKDSHFEAYRIFL
jgi:hypothetical protein